MTAESENDLKALKAVGRLCAETLRKMMKLAHPGMTTAELDQVGGELLEAGGARSAPQVTYNFPGATCISVAPVIAHGIPNGYVLKDGDLIHIDVSAELDGYYADTGASLVVGHNPAAGTLLEATKSALWKALRAAKAGHRLNEIGRAVQMEAQKRGYQTIVDLTGHGIGHSLHEAPKEILNFYNPQDKRILHEGQVLAIEPFLTTGKGHVVEQPDGWALRTIDRHLAAQFEHTIVVTKAEPIILTMI